MVLTTFLKYIAWYNQVDFKSIMIDNLKSEDTTV